MNRLISILFAALLLPAVAAAQTRQASTPKAGPGRVLRATHAKIIQCEDERTATPELLEMLKHRNQAARRRAILAVGRIGDPSTVPLLVDLLLNDPRSDIRALAAFALGEIESDTATAALLDRLQTDRERSTRVRARAVEALGKIASNRISAQVLGQDKLTAIAEAIARSLPPTHRKLRVDDAFIGSLALTALLRMRQPSTINAIIAQLQSGDADVRWQAANALARLREGIAPAVPALIPLLDDKAALVRAHAARALGVAKSAQSVEPLIRLLGDADGRVVANAINALGAIGDPRAVGPLAEMGHKRLVEYHLFDRARYGVPAQQNHLLLMATALGNIKDSGALPLLKGLRFAEGIIGPHPEVEIAVAKFGEAAFFDVPDGVKLPQRNWKAVAAHAQGLGQLGTERAKATLLDLLSAQPDPRAVSDILNALAATKVAGLREILLKQLKAEDVIVRTTAATLLGEMGDFVEETTQPLKDAYQAARADTMNDARIAIMEALSKLRHPITSEVLTGPTRDPDYVVRLKAIEMIRQSESLGQGSVGPVGSGHDRAYYDRVARLAASSRNPTAILHMPKGKVRIALFASDAPMTVDSFIQLARRGFFNGLTFMRVVPNFVIQGGDPRNDMNGGPDYQIRCEINERRYGTGAVGMALSGKDTGGSQFFITHSPQPHLDGGYTVFGQVVGGMSAVNRIARDERIVRVEIR
jgi:cyclophilin family peptidyl-prolyl cis-trans isomerase/HEAT repeat protein